MRESLETLRDAAQARALSAPAWFGANPWRAAALEWVRQRNAGLDALFYDVGCIAEAEARAVAPWIAHEGAILWVPPTGEGALRLFPDLAAWLAAALPARTLSVAGVGSSALGAAALARNIADARGEPAIAVVSGYGLADLPAEAMGGWFLFGALNRVRHAFEGMDRAARVSPGEAATFARMDRLGLGDCSLDVGVVAALLEACPALDLLVGHSKGNLVLAEALFALRGARGGVYAEVVTRLRVVTLSAMIEMPRELRGRVFDVMGGLDQFGLMNSRDGIEADLIVEGAGHSTNPEALWLRGFSVTEVLKRVLPQVEEWI
jgi:hypothetical protein